MSSGTLGLALKQATPVVVDHAKGSWIHGTDGVDHLDFTTGISASVIYANSGSEAVETSGPVSPPAFRP